MRCSSVAHQTTPVRGHAIGFPSAGGCVRGRPASRTAPIFNIDTNMSFFCPMSRLLPASPEIVSPFAVLSNHHLGIYKNARWMYSSCRSGRVLARIGKRLGRAITARDVIQRSHFQLSLFIIFSVFICDAKSGSYRSARGASRLG